MERGIYYPRASARRLEGQRAHSAGGCLWPAAVKRVAISQRIEHQTPVGASRNSCTPHARPRLGQVDAGHQVLPLVPRLFGICHPAARMLLDSKTLSLPEIDLWIY